MAYSTNRNCLLRMEDDLNNIIMPIKPGSELKLRVDDAKTYAYYLRQAIHYAKQNNVKPYASLQVSIIASEDNKALVIKKKRAWAPILFPDAGEEVALYVDADVNSLGDVIITVSKNSLLPQFHFPDLELNESDLLDLINWADATGYVYNSDDKILIKKEVADG